MPPLLPRAGSFRLDRASPPQVLTLVAVTAVGALNMNIILPSLPGIARDFAADYTLVALAVSAYLALTAGLQLVLGPLSDRYGRRPVLLGTFTIFLAATLGCVLAPTVGSFLLFRLMQAAVASSMVLSRAIVRDLYPPDQAASLLGYVTMGMSLAPLLGPMIGGVLDEAFGWRSVFAFTLATGTAATLLIWADLGETNQNRSASFTAQFRSYPELIRARRFWAYALTATFTSGAFFAFLGGGPWVATHLLGLTPAGLGLHYGMLAAGYMFGNFLSGRFAARIGLQRMMLAGALTGIVGLAGTLALVLAGPATPLGFFATVSLLGIGNGLVMPSANAGTVSVLPHLAGSASGLAGAMMIGGGAALSVLGGSLATVGAGWLVGLMLVSCLLGLATTLWLMSMPRPEI